MKKILASFCAFMAIVGLASAWTVTNQGQVITVNTLDKTAAAVTTGDEWDQSMLFVTPKTGYIAATYDVTAHGGTMGSHSFSVTVPKGAVLLENGVVQVNTATLPTDATVEIGIGGKILLAAGTNLAIGANGFTISVPTLMASNATVTAYVGGTNLTAGNMTVLVPIMWGQLQ